MNERLRRKIYISEIIVDSKCKWTQDLFRMNDTDTPTLVYEYTPIGRRNVYRPSKRRNKPGIAYTLLILLLLMMMIMTSGMTMCGHVELYLCTFLPSAFHYGFPSDAWGKNVLVPVG
jgi:hypothetical protein